MSQDASAPRAPQLPPPYGLPLSIETAKRVMAAAEGEAKANGWPMAIAIVDSGGHLVLFQRLDQASFATADVAQRKAKAAVSFRRPTKSFEDALTGTPQGIRLLSLGPELVALEGGVPLVEAGAIVGAIGVSGMQSFQDGQVANAGARVLG